MKEHVVRRRWSCAVLVLAILTGACSSTGAGSTKAVNVATRPGGPIPSSGCSLPAPYSITEQRQNIRVDGVARWYLLTVPSTRQGAPLPVVIDLHGLSQGAELEAVTTGFSAEANANGFMVVFPEGTGNPTGWDIDPGTSTHPNRDIDFMNAILDKLEATMCVDKARIYSTGLSDGALFTSLLACADASRFAAFAPVAGVVMPTPCNPGRPVPIVAFHGTADPILPFNGGTPGTTPPPVNLSGPGYPANVQAWAVKDGCDPVPTDTQDTTHVVLRSYRCPTGVAVDFYIVEGGGHAWPGSTISAMNGPSTFEINATQIIWKFFRRYHLSRT
jgi:polyhydroxybutyrate depolymerase